MVYLSQMNKMWCFPTKNITFQPNWMNYVTVKRQKKVLGEVFVSHYIRFRVIRQNKTKENVIILFKGNACL